LPSRGRVVKKTMKTISKEKKHRMRTVVTVADCLHWIPIKITNRRRRRRLLLTNMERLMKTTNKYKKMKKRRRSNIQLITRIKNTHSSTNSSCDQTQSPRKPMKTMNSIPP